MIGQDEQFAREDQEREAAEVRNEQFAERVRSQQEYNWTEAGEMMDILDIMRNDEEFVETLGLCMAQDASASAKELFISKLREEAYAYAKRACEEND